MTRPASSPTAIRARVSTDAATLDNRSNLDRIADIVSAPVVIAQRVLPVSAVPIVLGTGALVLAGAVELPMAGAFGLGYLALRGWRGGR